MFPVSEIPDTLLPVNHSRQSSAIKMLTELSLPLTRPLKLLDLGCGSGNSEEIIMQIYPNIEWNGVDLHSSPEVDARTKQHGRIYFFDGVHLPFPDGDFDVVYTRQVLEHVQSPFELMREVSRVMKPGGYLVGSVSQMEPYHSFSFFNWTPYSLNQVCRDSGLILTALRPGIDVFTLVLRSLSSRKQYFNRYFENESPANCFMEKTGRFLRKKTSSINAMKIKVCGHICFLAEKNK